MSIQAKPTGISTHCGAVGTKARAANVLRLHRASIEASAGQVVTPASQGATPASQGATPRGYVVTPASQGATPAGHVVTPSGQGATPASQGESLQVGTWVQLGRCGARLGRFAELLE